MNIRDFAEELECSVIVAVDEDRMNVLLDLVEDAVVGAAESAIMAAVYAARLLSVCRILKIDAFEVLQFVETDTPGAGDYPRYFVADGHESHGDFFHWGVF